MAKKELLRSIASDGGRVAAALALGGGILSGLYYLDTQVAEHRADRVEACYDDYSVPEARQRCVDDADGLRIAVGIVEGSVAIGAVLLTSKVAAEGVMDAFGYEDPRENAEPLQDG